MKKNKRCREREGQNMKKVWEKNKHIFKESDEGGEVKEWGEKKRGGERRECNLTK